MLPIRIIDSDFNLLGEIDTYTSLQWDRKLYKSGEFELHINPCMQHTDKLKESNIIFKVDDPEEAAVINYRNMQNENGTEELIIKGSFLDSFVSRRITIPPAGKAYDYINSNAENVLKHYVDVNCINPTDTKRVIPNLVLGKNLNRGNKIIFQSRHKQLDEELEKIAIANELGWGIFLDIKQKKYIFDVIGGKDLTANQDIFPPVIFSTDFDNIESQSYTSSSIGYKNTAVVAGQGEGIDRKILSINDELEGLNRYETFIDARDIGNSNTSEDKLTEKEIEELLKSRGQQNLSELQKIKSLESRILTNSNLVYKKDYDLGAIVTIQNRKWGVTLDARITEIKEIIEQNELKLEAIFGNSVPTLIEKIKQELGR